MADISVTVQESGEAYVSLVVGDPPEVRDSVALGEHDAADQIPALDGIVLEFDHYGRLVGLRVTDSADSVLAPSLIEAAARRCLTPSCVRAARRAARGRCRSRPP